MSLNAIMNEASPAKKFSYLVVIGLANLRNALLLATSNRSEAAVGYATMDGDTCGGLSPIGGIDKAFLRDWLRVDGERGRRGARRSRRWL